MTRLPFLGPGSRTAAFLALLLALPWLLGNTYYVHTANTVLLNTIIAIGLNLVTGYAGQVSLGHSAFYALGAYAAGVFTLKLGLSFWLALPVALAVTGFFGAVAAFFTLHLEGPYLAMATIGVGEIMRLFLVNESWFSGGPGGLIGIPPARVGPISFSDEKSFYYLVLGAVILVYVVSRRILDSRIGRSFIAIREREGAARSMGVDTTRAKILAFTLSTIYAALAGALYAQWRSFISPDNFTFGESLSFLSMILVGGFGSLPGSVFGAVVLTLLPETLRGIQDFRMVVYALLIYFSIAFFPRGIAGLFRSPATGSAQPTPADHGEPGSVSKESGPPRVSVRTRDVLEPGGPVSGAPVDVLRVTELTKSFGGLTAVNAVNLTLERREIRALIGPNGSGKTTFLNLLAGWYRPTSGRIVFEGADVTHDETHVRARKGIARTFQNILLFGSMSALDNILVGLHSSLESGLLGVIVSSGAAIKAEGDARRRARELLDFVGLAARGEELAKNLPYGEQRRLEIARALALSPKLLLLDEPSAGMNARETEELIDLIFRIRGSGVTILVVEHDMRLVMGAADRITVFNYGGKIAEGTPKEIQNDERVIQAYLGRSRDYAFGS